MTNLHMTNLHKAIFFDRDGVLNKERKDYVKIHSELEIFPNIGHLIKKLTDAGFLIIVITNQSAINRGFTSHENLSEIHSKLQKFLQKNDTKIDSFYYCPHTPNENCDCRKPNPGLILRAVDEFKINLQKSWMIGDNDTDIQAAINSGCKYFKINSNHELPQIVKKILDQDIGEK